MSSKKHSKKKSNKFPFTTEIKQARYGFKKMIDEMSDEEFIDFTMLFLHFIDLMDDDFEFDDTLDDDFEDYEDMELYDEEDIPF